MALASTALKFGAPAGIAGLAAGLGQVLDAPRRFLWHDILGGPETGAELVQSMSGMSQDNPLTKILGTGAEILGDPLFLTSLLPALKAGAVMGTAGRNIAGRAAELEGMKGEMAALQQARQLAASGIRSGALEDEMASRAVGSGGAQIPSHAGASYAPEVLNQLPSVTDLPNTMRSYSRMSGPLQEALADTGLGYAHGAGGTVYSRPDMMYSSGGKMFSDPIARSKLNLPSGYLGTLTGPGTEAADVMNLRPRLSLPPDSPTLARTMPSSEAAALARQLPQASQGLSILDLQPRDALSALNQRLAELRGQYANTRNLYADQATPVERLLMSLGG